MEKRYPDRTFEHRARTTGAKVVCLWEIPGPKDTQIAWLSGLAVNASVAIVQTYKDGGWDVYTSLGDLDIESTIVDALIRCRAPGFKPKTPGQMIYEADCLREPKYPDGSKRKSWNELRDIERDSWERTPPRGTPVVKIEVSGGVAECTSQPPGVDVEIIDHDNEQDLGGDHVLVD